MPWKESRIMDQRMQFLASYQKEEMSVADLCRTYEISRPTAYRWINRYNETGPEGLVDRSRRPHSCSHATLEPIENAILAPSEPRLLHDHCDLTKLFLRSHAENLDGELRQVAGLHLSQRLCCLSPSRLQASLIKLLTIQSDFWSLLGECTAIFFRSDKTDPFSLEIQIAAESLWHLALKTKEPC